MSSLTVKTLTLGELSTNCYLVSCPESDEALIIDPADSGDYITEVILQDQLKPVGILLTHGHFDHVLGVLELKLNFGLPVYLHPADAFLLERAADSAQHWLKRAVDPVPPADLPLGEGMELKVGSQTLKIIETPGHTPGSISVVTDECLFVGDTVFKEGVGRTDFKYCNKRHLWDSIEKIRAVADGKLILPGHGEEFRF